MKNKPDSDGYWWIKSASDPASEATIVKVAITEQETYLYYDGAQTIWSLMPAIAKSNLQFIKAECPFFDEIRNMISIEPFTLDEIIETLKEQPPDKMINVSLRDTHPASLAAKRRGYAHAMTNNKMEVSCSLLGSKNRLIIPVDVMVCSTMDLLYSGIYGQFQPKFYGTENIGGRQIPIFKPCVTAASLLFIMEQVRDTKSDQPAMEYLKSLP